MIYIKQRSIIAAWLLFIFLSLFNSAISAKDLLTTAAQQTQNGFYRAALSSYEQALLDAQQAASPHQQQLAKAGLGHTLYLLNQPQPAIKHLQQALTLSKQTDDKVNGQIHYYLSLIYGQLGDNEAFESHWQDAMNNAKQHTDQILQAYLHLTAVKWATNKTDLNHHLKQIQKLSSQADSNQSWGIIHLNVAEHLIQHYLLGSLQRTQRDRIRLSHQHLQQAQQYLPETALRPQAQVIGLLGTLYETDHRYHEALTLSLQALQLAQQAAAQDLLMLYEWQAGRLYHKLDQPEAAIDSYRRAVNYVETIRQDIPVRYQDGKSSFKELLGPLYLDLADVLLQKAWPKQNNQKQVLLDETRDLLEQLKQTELEDFFQDRCLIQEHVKFSLDDVAADTAVLYPVLLTDRLEWLISINGQLQQVQIKQSQTQLDQQIRQYTADLRNARVNNANKALYQLLFEPLQAILQQHGIKTLVYIPDGVLRLLPLSVLSDGEQYLIEQYAIVTVPGLNLLNPRIRMDAADKSLLVGLSHPTSAAVDKLPSAMLTELTGYSAEQEASEQQRNLTKTTSSGEAEIKQTPINNRAIALNQLAEALVLPGVITEIEQLAGSLPNTTLLNQQFTLSNFKKKAALDSYNIVHIASHGFFGGDSKDSFIMTYDKLLTMDELEGLLRGRDQDDPVNMLTLSACQTAEGDDRAPLGFSGIAIKANAQTALGSLWPISDDAAVKLMNIFYHQLIIERHSKVKALQIAQQKLINDPEMSDPFFWAPFILVGHWQ